jgi:predicted ATPase/class 3 adenylate cyclase/Tfp pilus assembly protein PilF
MAALPTGTVTFLYTDIEGSARRWEERPAATRAAVDRHFALLRAAVGAHRGRVFRIQGDGLCAAFATAPDALAAALAAQLALHAEPWPEGDALRVRMALHTGAAEVQDGDYVGACLNRLGRLLGISHGGQTLLSRITHDLVRESVPAGAGLRDLGAHRLRDLAAPEQLFQLLHPDLPEAYPPLRSLDALQNNLPLQLTSFVGREREIGAVGDLLDAHRLVTLTGTGGCGKTRLALQVAAGLGAVHPDGVWFVDLAPLTDPALVPQVVLAAMGLREAPSRPALATLTDHLGAKTVLLLLDNCEHLVEACARVADALLRACPCLRVLATSREALGVAGETAWRVPSLAVPDPDPGRAEPIGRLAEYEAVRLFVDRAAQVQPAFALTDRNAAAVAQVCRRLDGVPLALELAAARVRVLAVEQILARLDDRFQLLTGGSRTALPRQQTLRAALDWSHDLLSEPERALLRRLSVFAGGWTLEAAEAVCAPVDPASPRSARLGPSEPLDVLTGLVDKSLVLVDETPAGMRYRCLETIRGYGLERLAEAGEAEPVRRQHAGYFLALAVAAEPHLTGAEQVTWLGRLTAEHDNLRAALRWTQERGQGEMGMRLAGALWRFWMVRGHVREGYERLAALLATGPPSETAPRAKALLGAGVLVHYQGEQTTAEQLLAESLAAYRALGDRRGSANALTGLGIVAHALGDDAAARPLHEESLAILRELGDRHGVAVALNNLGQVLTARGDYAAARASYEESLALRRDSGDALGIATALMNLGWLDYLQGDYGAARGRHEESLAISRRVGGRLRVAQSLINLANLARERGEYATARAMYQESLTILTELDNRLDLAEALEGVAALAAVQTEPARAVRLGGAAAALRERIHAPLDPIGQARLDSSLAPARQAQGADGGAAAWAEGRAMTLEQAVAYALSDAPEEPAGAAAGSPVTTDSAHA